MNPYEEAVIAIVEKQASILGSAIAYARARQVSGLEIDEQGHPTTPLVDGLRILGELVSQYQELLGPAGIAFCRDAALPIIKKNPELVFPESLK